jgi:hypothetical protein
MNPSLRLPLLLASWSPVRLFGSADLGAIYEPQDFASLFQEAVGNTAVTAAGQLLGMVLDKRYSLARGAELSASLNGYTNSTAGVTHTDTSFVNGAAVPAGVTKAILTVGKTYEVTIAGSISGGADADLSVNTADALSPSARTAMRTGFGSCRFRADTTILYLRAIAGMTVDLTAFSVKEIPGNHALQATAGSRPTLNAGGKINYSSGAKSLVTTWASSLGTSCTVAHAVQGGEAVILTGQTITTTFTDTTDHCGRVIINRDLTATETSKLRRWLNRRAG